MEIKREKTMNRIKQNRFSLGENRGGFTLLEVMISVALLSIGLVAIGAMQILGTRGNVGGEDRSVAANLIAAQFNEFAARAYRIDPSLSTTANSDSMLDATGGYTPWLSVNEYGLSKDELVTRYGIEPQHENFKYEIRWMIEDMENQELAGAWKRVSIQVRWSDMLTQTGENTIVQVGQIPISARYM